MARTSKNDLIQVGFLEGRMLQGRLGLMAAPGKYHWPAPRGTGARDLDADLLRLRQEHDVRVLVTLLTDEELIGLRIERLPTACRSHGIEQLRLPIRDGSVPEDPAALVRLVEHIRSRLRDGKTVVVHCLAGLGRSGLVVACTLVADGRPPAQAISVVRKARPGAIETLSQVREVERFVDSWQRHRATRYNAQ